MTDKVNIYELMTSFWRENDYEPFSTAETALFFFLVGKCNSRHWKMPVKCPTSVVCRSIKVSKQTVITAREALRDKGLIKYTKGNGNSDAPGYTIITDPRKWTDELTIIKTDSQTDSLTIGETDSLTICNIKDEKNKDIISSYNTAVEKKLSLDESEKYAFVKMLRAQMSDYEQILLYYNSLSPMGYAWQKPLGETDSTQMCLLCKYRIIKNVPHFFYYIGISPADYFKIEKESYAKQNIKLFEQTPSFDEDAMLTGYNGFCFMMVQQNKKVFPQ